MLTTMSFYIVTVFYGMLWGIGGLFIGLMVSILAGTLMLRTPFTPMLEGKGILCLDVNSTGIIRPFVVAVRPPYIHGKVAGQDVTDVFDRETVFQLATPKLNSTAATPNNKGGITIDLDEEEYNSGRFALFHFPVLIWNSQIGSIITKDFLAEAEKTLYAEHSVIYLQRKVEELTGHVRDFGRYIVEQLKPKGSMFANKWVIWIIIIFAIILIAMFAPSIINSIKGSMGGVTESASALTGNAITPRP